MMTAAGHRGIVCCTDRVAAAIEELQFTLGEGPCIDAFHRGPVLLDDLAGSGHLGRDPWPMFTAAAFASGARALFAFPLQVGAVRIGAFDLYRDQPGPLDETQLGIALTFADELAVTILRDRSPGVSIPWPADGSSSHAEVHQASGILSVQLGMSVEDAFVWLRARAFASGRPVVDLAHEVVNSTDPNGIERRGTDDETR